MTIHINETFGPDGEIIVSGTYSGSISLSYGEQVELISWFLHNRPMIVTMIQNRGKQ